MKNILKRYKIKDYRLTIIDKNIIYNETRDIMILNINYLKDTLSKYQNIRFLGNEVCVR